MYEEYWGLSERPFQNIPDPRFLFPTPQHQDAIMKLTYVILNRMGAGMLSGVFGCGKTLVAKKVIENLGEDKYKVSFIQNPLLSHIELLRSIVRSLKPTILPEKKSELLIDYLLEILSGILLENTRDGKDTVIIIDEAHIIEDELVFEELRLLLNLHSERDSVLTLLLVGQPELSKKVGDHKPLDQRIAMRCYLDKLNEKEVKEYIFHRLKVCGGKDNIFDDDAVKFIAEHSGSIPRRINHLCDVSLLYGFGKKLDTIDRETVKKAMEEFGV